MTINVQKEKFQQLLELLKEPSDLGSMGAYLNFDEQTVAPPSARDGILKRLKARSSRMAHEAFVNPAIGTLINYLIVHNSALSKIERAVVKQIELSYRYMKALPPDVVEQFELKRAHANIIWAEARKNNNSAMFMPAFTDNVDLAHTIARLVGGRADGDSEYAALLPQYEPGMPLERIDEVVGEVREWAIGFLREIEESGVRLDNQVLCGNFDPEKQGLLAETVVRRIGYDFNRGHLSKTTHPFSTTCGPDDHRITMRINPRFLPSCFFAVIHEAGHALYEQNVDPLIGQIVNCGLLRSSGIHETSSRLWENLVGRDLPFLEFMYPTIQALFPVYNDVPLENFYQAVNRVEPSFIRVEADEVTYLLHIAIRYEIERAFMRGDLTLEDVPAEWDRRFMEYFGIKVDTAAHGWLQDVHWSYGYIGYFVTYLLGNLAAAQLMAKFKHEFPGWAHQFRSGNFTTLLEWLTKKWYRFGHVKSLDSALVDATGEKLSPQYFIIYARQKFGSPMLYDLK